jgi:hypothetical protein
MQKSKLPKAKLFSIEWLGKPIVRRHWWGKFRLANAASFRLGPVLINWRMPWLERSARTLHPELFDAEHGERE